MRGGLAYLLGAAVIAIALALLVAALRRTSVYRYRVTVEVDTPAGLRSGSAVHEFRFRREFRLGPDSHATSIDFKGEAVAVDLREGPTLYALVRISGPDFVRNMIRGAFGQTDGSVAGFKALLDDAQSRKREGAVAPLDYPTFVVFRDERDPESVVLVEPRRAAEQLGAGVTIKNVVISMTDDPVTTGIRARLPWHGRYPEPPLKAGHGPLDSSLPAKLRHGDFTRGIAA